MLPEKLLSLGVQKLIDDGFAAQPYPRQHLSIEQVEYLVKKVNQQDNSLLFLRDGQATRVVYYQAVHIETDYDRSYRTYFGYHAPLNVVLSQGYFDDTQQPYVYRTSLLVAEQPIGYQDNLHGAAFHQVGLPLIRTALNAGQLKNPKIIELPGVVKVNLPLKNAPFTMFCTLAEKKKMAT